MRSLLLAILLSSACATTQSTKPGAPVNVATVKNEINGAIHAQRGERSIYSMGKTSYQRAVVYTESKAGVKQEETWVKSGDTWRLENATALTETTTAR
jgi:hypothetical protein